MSAHETPELLLRSMGRVVGRCDADHSLGNVEVVKRDGAWGLLVHGVPPGCRLSEIGWGWDHALLTFEPPIYGDADCDVFVPVFEATG